MNYSVATAFVDEPVAGAAVWHVATNVFVVEPVASAVVWPGTPMNPKPKATRPGTVADVVTSPWQNMLHPAGNASRVPHMSRAPLSQYTL